MSKARDLAGIFNLNPTSGTTAQRPATADVGEIYYNGTTGKTQIYTPTGWQDMASGIPYGNTAGRPAAVTGQPYFNGETARLEMYTAASGWQNIVQEVPGVASITGNYSEATNSGTITIAGTNFVSGAIASAIGTNGVEVIASSTTYNSLVQITAAFTGLSNAYEPYDIKVTNPSNLFGLIPDALYVNASPVWQTASGSLGTFNENVSISVSATATDSDSTVTYALASGSALPSGVTLNSSTGAISGTLPNVSANTTYTFTINASDGSTTVPRAFSITSLDLTSNTVDAFGDNSAVLYYKLDSDFTDFTGNASTFTTSAVTFGSGKIGNAAVFNGSSSYAFKNVSNILAGTVDRTYSLWAYINTGATGRQLLFGQGDFGATQGNLDLEANSYHNGTISDSYGVHYFGNGVKFDSATVLYDQWVHLVLTQSGGNINQTNTKLYVNGVQKTLNSTVPSPTPLFSIPTNSKICIGTRNISGGYDLFTNGKIDQIRVFNKVLTQSEVNTLYRSGSGF